MARYVLKQVFWNTNGYRRPSGYKATAGFPMEYGYGHEEWNNSEALKFMRGNKSYRAFHTERIGEFTEDDNQDIFVFLYASHGGLQQLVGAAGRAIWLTERERVDLTRRLNVGDFRKQAWAVPQVKACFNNDEAAFNRHWKGEHGWRPNLIAPAEFFFEPAEPVTLDPRTITGKGKLLTQYKQFTPITAAQAALVLASVPESLRNRNWHSLLAEIGQVRSDVDTDLRSLRSDATLTATSRRALIDARLGQGAFRASLLQTWGHACAVTGCTILEVLRASHIKAWCQSSSKERLDPANGLLLSANLDALFDRSLISFDDNGDMLVSPRITDEARTLLGVPSPLRHRPSSEQLDYLRAHRAGCGFE